MKENKGDRAGVKKDKGALVQEKERMGLATTEERNLSYSREGERDSRRKLAL